MFSQLGTDTKCLGGKEEERGTQGCLLHDSHAEVIARRSFLRFLYKEILNGNSSVLIKKKEKNKFEWNPSIRLYMFVSYLSSIFPNISVTYIDKRLQYVPSSERSRPCAMSIGWWKGLDPSSCVVTVDGYPLGQVKKLRTKQQYANPLSKCALLKLYLQLMDHLSSTTTTYAQAKALSSNSLRTEFMSNHPQWIETDPQIFYSFTLSSPLNNTGKSDC